MVFGEEDKALIKVLRQEKVYCIAQNSLSKSFRTRTGLSPVKKLLTKILSNG